ncbi:GlsB/YeaQ/YmgE family stress response membrane protein [Pedobacter sp. PAMC26386]|nr:GlsB/YeaQ/YmgE family stress response membrane protein [Pedobacter sp. PAMC26386]
MHLLFHILLGGIAGWLAGKVMKGDGYGVIFDILLGLIGGWVGGALLGWFNIHTGGDISYLITAFLGAVLLVWISRLIKG